MHGRAWRVGIRALVVVVPCLMTVASLVKVTSRREWRQQQEFLIAVEVLYDLTTRAPDPHDRRLVRDSYCVFVSAGHTRPSDPPAAILAALRSRVPRVHPASECDSWDIRSSGEAAARIGVSSFQWKADDFVRVEGWRTIGELAGGGWIYTLSLTADGWKVDTVRDDWIS